MRLSSVKPAAVTLAGAAIAVLLMAPVPGAWADTGPFMNLAGDWTGSGTISISNGTRERIRCKATYTVGNDGNHLEQQLRCASDSYKFEVSSKIDFSRGGVSGSWTELTRNAYGKLSGLADVGRISGGVEGSAFSASVAVITNGSKQTVTIRPLGQDVTQVQISLNKH
jgi:hypothetical protein